MKNPTLLIFSLVLGVSFLAGCNENAGDNPPVHPTKKVENMTKPERIDRIKNSPLPQQEKDRLLGLEQSKPK